MAITLNKSLSQKQNIKLTPSLKKSIDLLQLSRFELIKKIEKEIIENPFLKKDEEDYDLAEFNHNDFDFDIESKLTLRETLIKQLDEFHLNKKDLEISKLIICCIDESGELMESLDDMEEISKYLFSKNETQAKKIISQDPKINFCKSKEEFLKILRKKNYQETNIICFSNGSFGGIQSEIFKNL